MSNPLTLGIGKNVPQEFPHEATPAPAPQVISAEAAPPNEALAQVYEVQRRHEETLRDLIIEIRLLYHNLPDKEKQKLETRRDTITREVRENFASQIRAFDDKIARLRGR